MRGMSQIHANTDKLTLVAVALPDDKMRVTSRSWDDALPDDKMRVTSRSWDDPLVICRLPSSSCAGSTVV